MPIRVLEDKLINQIAAGEVVERPASVVKELMENSLDAGATSIEVDIEEGGRSIIKVTDNGSGIPAEQMKLAFTRHATSKLAEEMDLELISTLGFRGEALPSIASVAQVKMISSPDGSSGFCLELAGGEVIDESAHPSPQGTMMVVQELFYNVPARLKFLKSLVTESLQVHNTVVKLAVAHPEVSVAYRQNGRLLFKTPGTNLLGDTVAAIKGQAYAADFLEIYPEAEYRVWGLISRPELKRRNRREEIFLVNRRPVQSALLLRAMDEAYRGRLVSGEYPACYLHIEIPPAEVDVNVHPQKSEVRFRNEERVFRTTASAVKRALDEYNQQGWHKASPDYYEASHSQMLTQNNKILDPVPYKYSQELLAFSPSEPQALPVVPSMPQAITPQNYDFLILGQVFASYIVVAVGEVMMLVDQHAADESLRYNELMNNTALFEAQELLIPVVIPIGKRRLNEFDNIKNVLAAVGFQAEIIGDETLVLRGAPGIAKGREEELFLWLLDDMFTGELCEDEKEYFREAVASIACHQAVKANQRLDNLEMEILIKRLMNEPRAAHCPHGRPTFINISSSKVAEWFKR